MREGKGEERRERGWERKKIMITVVIKINKIIRDKGVVVGVDISGDKITTVIDLTSKGSDIFLFRHRI